MSNSDPDIQEFENYKKKHPDYFPIDQPLEKQLGVFKGIMAQLRQQKADVQENRNKGNLALDRAIERKAKDKAERADREEIEQEADRVLREGDPISYLKEQFEKIHTGDEIIFYGLLVSIGSQLCLPSDGIQPGLTGESGKGKTDSCRALYHLLPEEYKANNGFSNKSFFYDTTIKSGTIFFFDDAANLREEIQDMIKQSTSAFQEPFKYRTVSNGVLKPLQIPPRLVYWITTVEGHFDTQFLNRQLNLSVDDSTDQDDLVMSMTKERYESGIDRFSLSSEVKVCREIFKMLKDREPVHVKISYASKIHWNQPKNRRNLPMFFDTINALAAIRQYQRDRDSSDAILANRDDFDLAKKLWMGIGREQVGKLSPFDLRLLNCIMEKGDKTHDGIYSIPRQIAKRITGFSDYKMDSTINGKNGVGGLRQKVEGFNIIKCTKTTGDEFNRRTVGYDILEYDGSLDTFGQFNDLVWIVE